MSELADIVLPGSVTVADGEGGLPLLRVGPPGGAGEVYLHGAQVKAWAPAGQAPVIWMSRRSRFEPGRAIRGGVPICFPWFRIYRTTGDVTVRDGARTVVVATTGSANTVVWNPWVANAAAMPDFDDEEWPTMVCVETADVADDGVALAPGHSHALRARIGRTPHT